jgi:hypothetical protein
MPVMPVQPLAERDHAGSLPTVTAPTFTGRDRELGALGSALACPPAVVLVEGEAGVGKSRLLHQYLASKAAASTRPWWLSAVAEILAEVGRARVLRIGVPDRFISMAGGHQYLLGQAAATPTAVVTQVLTALG